MDQQMEDILRTYEGRFDVRPAFFREKPPENLCLVIAIPCFKEPDVISTLDSLKACVPPSGDVEVIVAVNAPESAAEDVLQANQQTLQQLDYWRKTNRCSYLKLLIVGEEKLPDRSAGAGLARKLAMDEGLRRWVQAGEDGPILCLDADCVVSPDYLVAAEEAFSQKQVKLGHFQFSHTWRNESDRALQTGIIAYELHLRCFIQGLKWAGYPFATHTVGSCMAVRASSYARSGGMNKRKAGEDFYFMHKLLPLGGYADLSATVFPSCRVSDRVPFGTGRAQLEWTSGQRGMQSYSIEVFLVLKTFFNLTSGFFRQDIDGLVLPSPLRGILERLSFGPRLIQFRKESKTESIFFKKFWTWMDGFMVLKLVHHLRDHGCPNQPILSVSEQLIRFYQHESVPIDLEIPRLREDLLQLINRS
ncbi:MAG: glycosyltransferase [Lunatimonas sp.]|uniref:glycosyltransferase family 2 protein n=1 Tax=Lunatimonas sp. TaxID=2060141 RepID=UPI00263B5DF1|nr:glycosyltransferase [Lunatimonas sp.]MCC5936908.1 glycosyltransferase [Lunatimonas sp.]